MRKLLDINRFRFYLWVGIVFMMLGSIYYLTAHPEQFLRGTLNNFWAACYVTVINYVLFEYTLGALSRKHIFRSILLVFLHILLYSWGSYFWRSVGIELGVYSVLVVPASLSHAVSDRMAYSVESLFFFSIVRHGYHYVKLKQVTQQLRIEKQQAELNYLKSQTNPHFLFNTLNNIYSLARDKSDLAPESILRLSKILRYMLYETAGPYIAIEQEVKIISDYIALEKLRYDESLRINFNNDVEDMRQAMPPLLLIPLVENAFKHGVSETRALPFVDIHLSVNKRRLEFVVKNSAESFGSAATRQEHIGLSNLRRQLELLYTDYSLVLNQEEFVFVATLQINLSSHV